MRTARLFLHPIGLDPRAKDWMDLPEMIAPTLPGHGQRRRPRAGLTLGDIADEVAGWTEGQLDVVGTLLGGTVALHLALDHPQRVRSLFLACTGAQIDASAMERRARAIEVEGTPVDETLERWFDAEDLGREVEPPPVVYARRCLELVDPVSFAENWRALGQHDVLARLPEIRVPTTWVAATRDVVHSPASIAALCDLIPTARFVAIDGPHMAPLGSPEALGEAIRGHLSWSAAYTG
jgi:pimeloyl-ACP methyl ester carboxylesterase